MEWTIAGAAATLAAWGAWQWRQVTAVRFQWRGADTRWRATLSVVRGRRQSHLAVPLWVPPPPQAGARGRQTVRRNGLGALGAGLALLARRTGGGRLWTRGTIGLCDAAASAVAVGAAQSAAGLWYAGHLAPLEVDYLRVQWQVDHQAFSPTWHGRIGGIFRFRTGDIICAILVALWVLRWSPKQEASAHGQQRRGASHG